ncbi:FadR/GntR family transcriptional regulator [Tropicibacter naphthalenivorans]|uniref:L-lactate utilization operon repressor n=1 Tax=Tropicibacter naphthalenivorans TaxID=441103 RepID=A0A0P1H0P8_9RHOB|nr:FadR/GntR family transcriptional regulator [Tropicibacter naphthalenivorans]CUH82512.1 L-lactate utilization operon repressor [Tropicibacter naphthalenivorans]SMD06856.1 transcriptional regulator, GntR family [Tropicibacter naphthalenivorans]
MSETKPATRVATVESALRTRIEDGTYKPADRLPSESQLTAEFGVSRSVVREAIAHLRAEGLVEARQGAGVFVLMRAAPPPLPFHDVDPTRLSSVIELLELRTAVEVEAAGLAAQRRSPAQEERLLEALAALTQGPLAEADFALHLAIAEATNNTRFPEFLRMVGPSVIPRHALGSETPPEGYQHLIDAEHRQIVDAILGGDAPAARTAMRRHLEGSIARYRAVLRGAV